MRSWQVDGDDVELALGCNARTLDGGRVGCGVAPAVDDDPILGEFGDCATVASDDLVEATLVDGLIGIALDGTGERITLVVDGNRDWLVWACVADELPFGAIKHNDILEFTAVDLDGAVEC